MKVDFGLVPERVTDIFFLLSSATERLATSFGDVSFAVYDSNDFNHQVFASDPTSAARKEHASAILMCRCTRIDQRHWSLDVFQQPCNGNVVDYRPMLLSLRAMQKMNHEDMPLAWPHRLMQTEEEKKKAPILPRLPPTIERRISNMQGRRQSNTAGRKMSSVYSSGAGHSTRRPSISPMTMGRTVSSRSNPGSPRSEEVSELPDIYLRQVSASPAPRPAEGRGSAISEIETSGLERRVSNDSEGQGGVELTARGRRRHRTSHTSMSSNESVEM
jgi:hypothetical protein